MVLVVIVGNDIDDAVDVGGAGLFVDSIGLLFGGAIEKIGFVGVVAVVCDDDDDCAVDVENWNSEGLDDDDAGGCCCCGGGGGCCCCGGGG